MLHNTRAILLFLYMLLLSVRPCAAQNELAKDTVEKIFDKISDLPEIKAYFNRVDSLFKGRDIKAQIILEGEPSASKQYYWMQVGINNQIKFTPEYNFYVYPEKMEVKFLDTMTDRIISLAQWRKLKR
jgi:hypothetical protein